MILFVEREVSLCKSELISSFVLISRFLAFSASEMLVDLAKRPLADFFAGRHVCLHCADAAPNPSIDS